MTDKIVRYTKLAQRKDFSRFSTEFFDEPNLLDIVRDSYNEDILKEDLDQLFKLYFPIKHEKNSKYVVHYHGILPFVKQKDYVNEELARKNGLSYEKALFVDLRLENTITGEIISAKKGKLGVSDGVFFGNIPQLTKRLTFIINGIEKNVVAQIVRAPGLYFVPSSKFKIFAKKKLKNVCELYPGKGSMMNIFVKNDILNVLISDTFRKNTFAFTYSEMLKAFGMSEKNIIDIFGDNPIFINSLNGGNDEISNKLKDRRFDIYTRKNIFDDKMINSFRNEVKTNTKIQEHGIYNKIYELLAEYENTKNSESVSAIKIIDKIISEWTARFFIEQLSISTRNIENVNNFSYQEIFTNFFMKQLSFDLLPAGRYKLNRKLRLTERIKNRVVACEIANSRIKNNQYIEKEQIDEIRELFRNNKFVNKIKFDVNSPSKVYSKQSKELFCLKIYSKDGNKVIDLFANANEDDQRTLSLADFLAIFSYACETHYLPTRYDDIEHLGNKRLKLINEQLKNKLNGGLAKVEKIIKDKLSSLWVPTANKEQNEKIESKATIKNIIITKHFQYALNSFFNTYQLTNFLDQQNPLSELSAKRKISAMGDGGISREDKNLEVRDIHPSQYGRICPIEAPEGQNVGLIMALGAFSKIDENGFITTPYRIVKDGKITNKIEYLTAIKEEEYIITDSSIPFDEKTGEIKVKTYACRYLGDYAEKEKNEIEYIEISPRQVISVSTNLVPFIESDEGHRGEMAANMQRQAIPLIKPHAPMVGTGFEHKIAKDSALGIIAEEDGVIDYADSERISVDGKKYKLLKFNKSNQNTCFNQKPLVGVGSKVKAGEMIADGPAMDNGEIALGQNIHVAFVPWNGYTFEDAIAISDRIAKNDILTSITIEEIICEVIKTQNGDEEVTRNIVNVSEEAKKMLDDDGIITIGAYVKEGDIIVGKNSPKGKSEKPTDEEKFFYQYFGNKISEYKDKSMHVKYGSEGVVCYVKRIPSNKNDNISNNVIETIKVYVAQKRKLQVGDKLAGRHGNKGVVSIVVPEHDMPHYADGTPIDICLNPAGVPSRMNLGQIMETHFGLALRQQIVNKLFKYTVDNDATAISQQFGLDASIAKKIIKVASQYVHDTKTIGKEFKYIDVAIILKQVGLEFEDLNLKVSSPGFFGANIKTIEDEMKEAGINVKENGKTILYDGKTGNAFDNPITTGIIYMMKLDHMIEDKIHARSVGPYSKITQQPLGGKSQNGGQRVGEMEVWAFEAYGAAYNLRELLTIKSDDVYGRNKMYKNIIYNQDIVQPSIPDAFLYMTKLLQGLCLQINVFDDENIIYDINDYVRKETKVVKSETFQQVSTNESSYGEGEIEE